MKRQITYEPEQAWEEKPNQTKRAKILRFGVGGALLGGGVVIFALYLLGKFATYPLWEMLTGLGIVCAIIGTMLLFLFNYR
ncbi:hypothetical protein LJC56_09025 [Christensenellaceae bacterium OttesenSCG-928-K19]|nr:hypothetical protein [Christensenellaceae bacterium OttesenSCG-928-K19]